jgi:ABC-type amino acid transport substrate-binding protein
MKHLLRCVIKSILILFTISALFSLVSCSIFENKAFRAGLFESGVPLVYMQDKKTMTGFEVELAEAIAAKVGTELSIKLLPADGIADALDDGNVDCVISSMESVHRLIDNYESTEPFISYGTVIVKLADDASITDAKSLAGKKVGVTVNTEAEKYCEEFIKSIYFDLRKYDYLNQPLHEILLKKKDAAVTDEYLARYYEKDNPQVYKTLSRVYGNKKFGIKYSKKVKPEMKDAIDEALSSMKLDGSLSELYIKWFEHDFS